MAQNPKLKIEVEAVDKATKTLEEAARAFRELSNSLKGTAKAAEEAQKRHSSFLSILRSETRKAGRYVDQLNSRFRALSDSIFNLKTAIAAALGGLTLGKLVKDGIEFNAQLQTAKLGLSALITSSYQLRDAQGEVLSGMEAFKAAQAEAERLYREILDRAMRTASTSKELLETFQAILPYAAQTGMSLQQALNMSEAFVNAAKALGLGLGQAAQEARALFMGDIDQNAQLLRALNITKEMVDTWREQGRLYDEVMKKLQPFVEASQEFADTWDGVTSSISDLISMLEGSIFKDTFRIMNEALKEVRDKLEGIINNEDELDKISKEIANKFLDAAEAIIIASDKVYQFGKTVYDFVNSHKEITEFGVLGYLLLGKRGVFLGTVIGGILEVAERSKNTFPTTSQIFKAQPNIKVVLGGPGANPQLIPPEAFKRFEEFKKSHPKIDEKPKELPLKEREGNLSLFASKSIAFIEHLRQEVNKPEKKDKRNNTAEFDFVPKPFPSAQAAQAKGSSLPTFEVVQNLMQSENFSLLFPQTSLVERLYKELKQKPFSDFSLEAKTFKDLFLTWPDHSLELQEHQIELQRQKEKLHAKFIEQYLDFVKEHRPEEWKKQKIEELREWYEEQKRVLGESAELQELYEHKKLEIEREAHEQEKKLFIEKLKQTSRWKAGVFQSLDELSKKWGDTNQLIFEETTRTFQALENSLETLFFDALQGKLKSLGSYVNSFIREVESAIAGIAAQGVAKGVVGFAGKIFGFDLKTAANGDIFPGHFIPLQAFADGGVVNRPTLGLIGEGKYPEAIVPLPDGRSIPVKFTSFPQPLKAIKESTITKKLLEAKVELPSGLSIPVKFENLPPIFKEYKEQHLSQLAFIYSLVEKEKVVNNQGVEFKAFATGGVVNKPTLGLIGESRYPEAIVPLPDGRSIPVKFEGKSNGQANIEIVLVDDRSKIPPPQIGKQQVVLWVAEDYMQNGILRKVIKA
ncbi:hypothetical protein GFV12_05165 [Desulfurobacterium thermolithotrophum]|uniref:hypothetical protein n=1 Tax=Desulfurobacterium thermolithotrophum TaxID=64160 RepID=UPI0013D024FE|nr:hypothetical protein [Desulfurobacterium thermolithotrophum]